MGGSIQASGRPIEKSSYVFVAAYKDPDEAEVTPATSVWTLTDLSGNVINSRQDVDLSPMATSHNIVLSGDDLAIQSAADDGRRILTVEATYNSATYGNGLGLNLEVHFQIDKLQNIT